MNILRKTIEEWNEFVDNIRLDKSELQEAKQMLGWTCKEMGEPACFGKDVTDWTDAEIVKWYREHVR